MIKPTVIDLFAGAGGFGLGFQMGGYEQVLSLEVDNMACDTLRSNNNHRVINADIRYFKTKSRIEKAIGSNLKPDVIIGGPPCQGFSHAASNRISIDDTRNSLFENFLFWVRTKQPRIFVIENVPGILKRKDHKGRKVIDEIKKNSKKWGYDITVWKLNSANYGVPQKRNRVFIIGSLDCKNLREPIFTHSDDDKYKSKKEFVTVGDAILDLPEIFAKEGHEEMEYNSKATNSFQKWARANSNKVFNHIAMKHTDRVVKRYESIMQGVFDFPDYQKIRRRSGGGELSNTVFKSNYRHLKPGMVSHTIPASFYSSFIHPTIPRNITAREAARIQSFPDSYVFKGTRTLISNKLLKAQGKESLIGLSQYNQVGNAVPPLMAKAVANRIKKLLV